MANYKHEHCSAEKTKRITRLGFPSLASLTLAACGGGGSNVRPAPPNQTPVVAADKTVALDEDSVDQALSITVPTDPDGNDLTITLP
jgi:hypothetical protein